MQLFDRRQPRHPERFAPDDDRQRECRGDGEGQRDIAERLTTREQILDQVDDAEAGAEQHQPADADQNSVPQRNPRRAAARRTTGPATARDRLRA